MNILIKFYNYQKVRFPIVILSLSLLPAILSSIAVVEANPSIIKILIAFIALLIYLLHIRIIDEQRDFEHDNTHHKQRPLQTGKISLHELRAIDRYSTIIFFFLSIYIGFYAGIIALIMLTFSYLAGNEFFIKEKIRPHFFIYNAINTLQTLIMQLFIYAFFVSHIPLTHLVVFHFLFTGIGTVIFELVRKIKIPGKDGTGKDTYSSHLGFNNSIFIYLILVAFNAFLFYLINSQLPSQSNYWFLFSISMFSSVLLFGMLHLVKRTIRTEQLMQLSFIILYGIFNLIIYLNSFNR